jgi:hypothetical protein
MESGSSPNAASGVVIVPALSIKVELVVARTFVDPVSSLEIISGICEYAELDSGT